MSLLHLVTMTRMEHTNYNLRSIALCCPLCVQFDTNHLCFSLGDIGAKSSYGTLGHINQGPSAMLLDFQTTNPSQPRLPDSFLLLPRVLLL